MEWIKLEKNDKRLENHTVYIVTDGQIVTTAFWDTNEFVGYDYNFNIQFWMRFPEPPKE